MTTLTRATLGAAALENDVEMFAFGSRLGDRIVCDDTAIIFDLYIELTTWNQALAELKYFAKTF